MSIPLTSPTLKELVQKLFTEYLDLTEESEVGHTFHPVSVSCRRVALSQPCSNLLKEIKKEAFL